MKPEKESPATDKDAVESDRGSCDYSDLADETPKPPLTREGTDLLSSEDNIEQSRKDASPADHNFADGMSADLGEEDDEWW